MQTNSQINRVKNYYQRIELSVIRQAIRDMASKEPQKNEDAFNYFKSSDFKTLCVRHSIDSELFVKSMELLIDYPLITRKREVNKLVKEFNKEFKTP